MAEESLMTVAEVAKRLRVSKMSVYRLVHEGELPSIRVGRSFRIWRSGVEKMIRTPVVPVPAP